MNTIPCAAAELFQWRFAIRKILLLSASLRLCERTLFFSPWALLFALCFCPAVAEAGTISITTNATTRVEGDRLHVGIRVTNRGSAAAHQVAVEAEALEERFQSRVQTRIDPGGSREFDFSKIILSSLRGSFPLTVLVRFQDSAGYPFSALTCTTFFIREKGNAGLTNASVPLTIKDKGQVRFRIQNESSHSRHIKTRLVLPNEFSSEEPEAHIFLPAGGKETLSFPIRNISAIQGAKYPVFLIQQYELDGVTHTIVPNALVTVASNENWFRKTRWHWAGGFLFATVFFIFMEIKAKHEKAIDISS